MIIRDLRPAIELIKEFEGLVLKPYRDSAGIPTIGIGTTVYPDGTKVKMTDQPITEEQAIKYLEHHVCKDLPALEAFISKNNLKLNNNQICSLLCFSYNVGLSPIVNKGRSLCDAILSGDKIKVALAMKLYCKAAVNGKMKVLNGLVRRRSAEAQLYCN